MKKKSLAVNAMLNSIKTLTTIIFPLITYPYITRVLSVENIGKINFGNSIISYFMLIAVFGLTTFAIRNGSQIREDRQAFNTFANRVFTINVLSALISCALLVVLVFLPTKVANYRTIILILGITVLLSPLAVDWLYTVYEDFGYITLRSFCVHLLALILMFVFVKKEQDVYLYVLLTVMATSLGNLFNLFHSRKYIRLRFTKDTHWSEYRKTIFVFFTNSIATTIYLNSGTTLLGLMKDDYATGIYGVATKIYAIFKQVFNAVVATTIPRLAFLKKNDPDRFESLLQKILTMVSFFILPFVFGILLLCREIILVISGEAYLEAVPTLAILAFCLFFAIFSNVLANGLLICLGREKYVVRATIVSAVVNIVLNFGFIPWLSYNGAAITTLIAEIIMLCMSVYYGRDYVKRIFRLSMLRDPLIAGVIMFAAAIALKYFVFRDWALAWRVVAVVAAGVACYVIVMLLLKDQTLIGLWNMIINKLRRKKIRG